MAKAFSAISKLARSTERRLLGARLIACDVDGTLLNRDEMIGVRTALLIKKIIETGIPFIFITARHHQAVEPFSEELRLTLPIVSLDGAIIRLPHGPPPMHLIPFDQEFALDIIEEAQHTAGIAHCVVLPDCFLLSEPDVAIPSRYEHWNIETRVARDAREGYGEILEVIVSGTFHGVNAIFNYVERKMRKGELHLRMYESQSKVDRWFLEIRSSEATKHNALRHLLRTYDISMKEVIGIGDDRNDIEFCGAVGYVVAMKNAVRDLRDIANFTTSLNCWDEGINEFLEYFLRVRGVDITAIDGPSFDESRRKRSR